MPVKIPDVLRSNIISTFADAGENWLDELPGLVEHYLQKWKLQPNGEFNTLTFNFVLPVKTESNAEAVLKIGPHRRNSAKEARALREYDGNGAVRLMDFCSDDGAMLIERVCPGADLQKLTIDGHDNAATLIAARLIQNLQKRQQNAIQIHSPMANFTHVKIWGLGFEKYLGERQRPYAIPETLILKADGIFKDLLATTSSEVLLHGDLHHRNILQATDNIWLAIDPKGMWGDPAFEVGAYMRNPMPALLNQNQLDLVLHKRIETFSCELGMNPQRIWGWSFAQCVLAAIWASNDETKEWQAWVRLAEIFDSIESKNSSR